MKQKIKTSLLTISLLLLITESVLALSCRIPEFVKVPKTVEINMKELGKYLRAYVGEHERFPENFEVLNYPMSTAFTSYNPDEFTIDFKQKTENLLIYKIIPPSSSSRWIGAVSQGSGNTNMIICLIINESSNSSPFLEEGSLQCGDGTLNIDNKKPPITYRIKRFFQSLFNPCYTFGLPWYYDVYK